MECHGETLEERLLRQEKRHARHCRNIRKAYTQLDFILALPWFKDHPYMKISYNVSTTFNDCLGMSISNVKIDEFMEEVLGPYFRKYGTWWELKVDGNEKNPTYNFKDRDCIFSPIEFQVKEGDFVSCSAERMYWLVMKNRGRLNQSI